MNSKVLHAIVILLLIAPVAATVQYPQEYYTLTQKADALSVMNYDDGNIMKVVNPAWASDYRTKAIQIALEKQNELLQEQIDLLKKIAPREENFQAGNSTVFYGEYGIDDPRYAHYDWNTSQYVMKKDVIQQDYTIWYCDSMNTSRCWKNASEVPVYSTEAYSWNAGGGL